MGINQYDLDFINKVNRILGRYTDLISVDEYFFASELTLDKDPLNIIEIVFLSRIEKYIKKGLINELPSEIFSFSICLIDFNKDSAIKFRKMSNSFRILSKISSDSKVMWTISYSGDPRCSKCTNLINTELEPEKEASDPSCPVENCDIPYNICTSIPVFKEIRDENGRILKHNKEYNKLIKIKIDRNEG